MKLQAHDFDAAVRRRTARRQPTGFQAMYAAETANQVYGGTTKQYVDYCVVLLQDTWIPAL